MNLYIFNEQSRAAVYGIGTYMRELTSSLKGSDINVCVVSLNSDKPQMQIEETNGIRYWHFPVPISELWITNDRKQRMRYFRNVVYLFQLHIRDKKGLIFHLNFLQYGSLGEELKKVFDCRIVSVAHFSDWGFLIFDNLQRLRNILNEEHPDDFGEILKNSVEEEKSYYSKADHCICLSNYMQEILSRDYGLDLKKISVIPNGLCDTVETLTHSKLLRKKWNIAAGEKIILFAGRMDKVKGLSYLIESFHKVLGKFRDCRLVIAGSGNYDRYLREAKDICTKTTFTGLLDKKDLYEFYQIADIGVIPSLFEPFGYVAVEMMMHELPIIATATSGLNEVVDDTCGLKVPVIKQSDTVEIDTSLLAKRYYTCCNTQLKQNGLGKTGEKDILKNTLRKYSGGTCYKCINQYINILPHNYYRRPG
jgi:glycosyltransferase